MNSNLSKEEIGSIFVSAYKACLQELFGDEYQEILRLNIFLDPASLENEIEKMGNHFAELMNEETILIYSKLGRSMLFDIIIQRLRLELTDEIMSVLPNAEINC